MGKKVRYRQISVSMDIETDRLLTKLSQERALNKSAVIRQLIINETNRKTETRAIINRGDQNGN